MKVAIILTCLVAACAAQNIIQEIIHDVTGLIPLAECLIDKTTCDKDTRLLADGIQDLVKIITNLIKNLRRFFNVVIQAIPVDLRALSKEIGGNFVSALRKAIAQS